MVQAPDSRVAQEPSFYGSETERKLAQDVESPGNRALAKLRRREPLEREEHLAAAFYIATMLERVPKRRALTESLVQEAMEQCLAEFKELMAKWTVDGADPAFS